MITILSKCHKLCLLWVDVKANLVCSFLSLEHARNYDKEECISIWRSYLAKSLSYINATALTFIRRMPYALKILSIFLFCIESNAWRKSIKVGTAVRFDAFYQLSIALMPSINRLRVSMWPTVDLPGLKSFWLSLKMFSIGDWIWWSNIMLYILAAIHVRLIPP